MNTRYRSVEDAYRNDALFRDVVDAIEAMIHRADITPSEARAAAVLACIHYETRNARSFRFTVPVGGDHLAELNRISARIDELKRWVDDDRGHVNEGLGEEEGAR